MVQCLYDSGNLIDWIQFYEDSVKAKWNTITTIKKIKYSLDDVFGVEYSDQIINRLKLYIVKTNSITDVVQE